ncbi:DUF1648 domain-containing protein [Larkinella terrae]|uniref:DUF1648 domain-containing protein n=1 Tax=Larkinella terrae TaxID=2025311 RepID=A0A7K0EV64_9BACT|nr:DUF1648 domain-containing protein [Larkinella terrae]MRS65446.1 DUF1648 domain-containing protein [Larkinella terrae]
MKPLLSASVPPRERFLNALVLILIISQLVLIIGYYAQLPEAIPVHFGLEGKPDRWGERLQLFIVPGLATFIFLLFWSFRSIPAEFYNLPFPSTPENLSRHLQNSHEMLAMLSLATMLFMTLTLWNWLEIASTTHPIINGKTPIALFVLALIGITIFYVRKAYRLK